MRCRVPLRLALIVIFVNIKLWLKNNKTEVIIIAGLLLVSAVTRLTDLGVFLTADEKNWIGRSYEFVKAFKDFRFNDMLQTTHPGVTTLWLSGLAVTLKMYLSHTPFSFGNLASFIAPAQLAIAIPNMLLVPVIYWLLRQLWPRQRSVSLLAGLFIALDPILIGYSRVVHVDALLAGLLFAGALSSIIYGRRNFSRFWLVVSAVFSGLAVLTKAPAIFALPFLLLVMIIYGYNQLSKAFLVNRLRDLTIWLLLVAIIFLVLWPAILLVPDPQGNVLVLKRDLSIAAETPHNMTEDYRLNADFYLFALFTRTSPIILILAVMSLAGFLFRVVNYLFSRRLFAELKTRHPNSSFLSDFRRPSLLIAYLFFFVLMMTLGAKKGGRYILPVFPAVDVLAALGLVSVSALFTKVFKIQNPKSKIQKIVFCILPSIVVLFLGVTIYRYHPYAIAYSSPLLPDNLSEEVGWGEGLEQVGAWLNKYDPVASVASWYPEELGAYTTAHVAHINAHEQSKIKYVVLYRNMFGRAPDHYANNFIDEYYKKRQPVYVVKILGKEFAWVYEKRVYERVLGELLPRQEVSQELTVNHDHLRGLKLMVATYSGRAKSGELLIELASVSGRQWQKWRVPIQNIQDNGWLNLSLDKEITIPLGETIRLRIWAEDTKPNDAPTIRYTADNNYHQTNFFRLGKMQRGDLAVSFTYDLNGEIVTEEDTRKLEQHGSSISLE